MINKANWRLVRAYLRYRKEVDQISKDSVRLEETWLRYLLEWADEVSFKDVLGIRPTFPEFVHTTRIDGGEEQLSKSYIKKIVLSAKRFLKWLSVHRYGFKMITPAWLDTLKPIKMPEEPNRREVVTLEEIRMLASAPVETIRDRRIQAAAVFWFLSGIRISAFVTLPISAVDLDELRVNQWPMIGVHTKFGKHATTFLLNIPDLLEVVRRWDQEIRAVLPKESMWFAPCSPDTGELAPKNRKVGKPRHQRARKDLRDWCARIDLPYYSPHKFRHGHAVYALKRAKNIQALNAVSQNLMHSNISITDGTYGILSETDVRSQIVELGQSVNDGEIENLEEIVPVLEMLLSNLKRKKRN